jgi:hypothetical protein
MTLSPSNPANWPHGDSFGMKKHQLMRGRMKEAGVWISEKTSI